MRYLDLGVMPPVPAQKSKKSKKKFILWGILLAFVTIIGFTGYVFYWPISSLISQMLQNPGVALSFFRPSEEQIKATDGKTNILVLGIDKRSNVPYTYLGPGGKQAHNGFLSDTIIIASIDRTSKKVSLISIPRDTWIALPNWSGFSDSYGKINSTYSLGDTYNYPGGGLKLARDVVEKHLGITIHYAARVDFEGFRKIIDTLDGIDVTVKTTFDDYAYPVEGKESASCAGGGYYCRYEHIRFNKGKVHMNGATALKYARSRSGTNGEGSDFARAKRQQNVITAAFKKATSLGTLFDPLKLRTLFGQFGETVLTDFDLGSLPSAVKLAKEIDISSIRTFVLDPSSGLMVHPANAGPYGGAYVIIPKNNNWGPVKIKIKEFLTPTVTTKETK